MTDFSEIARKAQLLRQFLEAQQKKDADGEHKRLIKVIQDVASKLGFTFKFDLGQATNRLFDPEPNPDVELSDGVGAIFIGDAKDA